MGRENTGFTLIELLVVVLIIGILATISVPQYEMAVEKARAAEAISIVRSLYNAQQLYYLSNGVWPEGEDLESLDWTYPGIKIDEGMKQGYFFTKYFHCRSYGACRSRSAIDYYIGLRGTPTKWYCCFNTGDSKAEKFCRSLWPEGTLAEKTPTWFQAGETCVTKPFE